MYLPLRYQRVLDKKLLFGWLHEEYPIEETVKMKWVQTRITEFIVK